MIAVSKAGWALTLISLIAFFQIDQVAMAQDLEDTIESEIDSLSDVTKTEDNSKQSRSTEPTPTPKPGVSTKSGSKSASEPSSSKASESDDSLFNDSAEQDEISELDMEPLESPFESTESPSTKKQKRVEPAPAITQKSEMGSSSLDSTIAIAPVSDEPNSLFEARLAKIYSEHGAPVSDEKWTSLVGSRGAETYSVQAGDTLWDLSRTLFADGFYWSRLWAENPEIQNPHRISKGQAIRFTGGNEASPPEIRVVEDRPDSLLEQTNAAFDREDVVLPIQDLAEADDKTDSYAQIAPARLKKAESKPIVGEAPVYLEDMEGKISQSDIEAGVIIEQNELVPRPRIPPTELERRPVLKDIPPSFVEKRPLLPNRTVTIQRRNSAAETVPAATVPSFIGYERRPEPVGTVVEAEAGENVAIIGQNVLIESSQPLEIGSRFFSVTERHSVEGGGYAYEVGGVIRLNEVADEKNKIYRGQVIYAVGPIRVGSSVLPGEPPRVALSTKGRRVMSKLTVVGGGEDADRNLFGDGAILYLRAQAEGEVQIGDVLAVQAKFGARKEKTRIPEMSAPVGILKVFAVSGKLVSAFVVLATSEIRKGDFTGPAFPTRLPDLVQEAPRVSIGPSE